jgi:low temperature requirement protein LtrA
VGLHGATFTRLLAGPLAAPHARVAPSIAAFAVAFVGTLGLWWLYFDRSAEAGAQAIARSSDPGRLGRSAYHSIHPIMVAGIIVIAAADEIVLADPLQRVTAPVAWLILGGTFLYIAGHAAFKAVVLGRLSWTRMAALAATALLGLVAPHVTVLALSACAAGVVIAVAVADYLMRGKLDELTQEAAGHPAGQPAD